MTGYAVGEVWLIAATNILRNRTAIGETAPCGQVHRIGWIARDKNALGLRATGFFD